MITPERLEQLRADAAKTADKYIRGDGLPAQKASRKLTAREASDFVNVAAFIIFQDGNPLWGGVRKDVAIGSLARIMGVSPANLIEAIKNPKRR
jgi:hypothetical protein